MAKTRKPIPETQQQLGVEQNIPTYPRNIVTGKQIGRAHV